MGLRAMGKRIWLMELTSWDAMKLMEIWDWVTKKKIN